METRSLVSVKTNWSQSKPIGHNPLSNTVKRLCASAGIDGFFTNHSLCRSCATCLFQEGIEEQVIMSRTGQKSLEGVRAYKTIFDDQQQSSFDTLCSKKS